jgi:hypothetical protein
MFLAQVTGKMTDFHDSVDGDTQNRLPAYATIIERRYQGGETTECKHFLLIRSEQEAFAKKCIDKGWTILAMCTNPRLMTNMDAQADGYILSLDLVSIQLP